MTNLNWWSEMLVRLTRGATPVEGFTIATGKDAGEKQDATLTSPPREPLTCETEFDVAQFPRWGNFR